MSLPRRLAGAVAVLLLGQIPLAADDTKLPTTGLAPARIVPDLCLVKYRIQTASPQCQAFFDQGLGYFYSYVWMEAARSFETATRHDPDCAMAWWGLSRALDKWGGRDPKQLDALRKAKDLLPRAAPQEKLLITARLQEKGLGDVPESPAGTSKRDAQRKAAAGTIDELLTLYDDEEGWYARAQLTDRIGSVAYYKSLLRLNPLHPGANHELVHFYEANKRPALGWVYAENYMRSSPGIPHAFHMQAHLATRLGRWDRTSDRSARAIELQREYHRLMNVKASEDHQFSHHLEILTVSLVHDGRFREARAVKEEARGHGYKHWQPWFRLHVGERDWDEALKLADQLRKTDKTTAAYMTAVVYLKKGDTARALPEVEVLQQAYQRKKQDRTLELRLQETQGMLLCLTGSADAGLKLMAKTVERTKNDFSHHAWGNGAYYMEAWGLAALKAGKLDVAEEAFLEALAHDPGSLRAAAGMQVLCERQGRAEEAGRFAELARRCWRRAEVQSLDAELADLRQGGETLSRQQASQSQ